MTSYYRIHDPIRGQKLLHDLIEYILYGRVYQGKQLNPFVEPFEIQIQMMIVMLLRSPNFIFEKQLVNSAYVENDTITSIHERQLLLIQP